MRETGVMARLLRRLRAHVPQRSRPVILMYHRIAEETFDPWGLCVSPANFARQIDWIQIGRRILPLREFVERHQSRALPDDAIAITFDDGYACTATAAAPILQVRDIPATVFIAPVLLNGGLEFWWDDLQRIVLSPGVASLAVDAGQFELGDRTAADDVWLPSRQPSTSRQRVFQHLWTILKRMQPDHLERTIDSLRQQAGVAAKPRETHRPMDAGEIRGLDQSVISFGSHSLLHASLPSLPPNVMETHIRESVEQCRAIIGHKPHALAYPFGDHDADCQRMVKEAGFACACTTEQAATTDHSNPFALPRLHVGNWSPAQLKRALRIL